MKFGKKLLLGFVMVTLLVLILAACGNGAEEAESTGGLSEEAASEGGEYTIAFVPKLVGFPYFTSMSEGAQKAAEEFGVNWIYQGPTEADVSEQAQYVSTLLDQGVDAVGIAANSPTAFDNLIARAKEEGITFFTTDSNVDNGDNQLFVQQASDKDLGYALADSIAEAIGEEGKVAVMSAGSTATNLNAWIDYMNERIEAEYPNITTLEPEFAGEDINNSTQIASRVIAANPDLKGFVGISAANTPGIAEAVKQAGKTGEIAVTGIGLPNVVRPYIHEGIISSAILWDPLELGYLTLWEVPTNT